MGDLLRGAWVHKEGRRERKIEKTCTTESMPRGYDALRDVLASANSPTQLKPHIRNLLNNDPGPHPSLLPPHDSLSPVEIPHSDSPGPSPSSPQMPPIAIPYNPVTRRTPPTSVLIPLTPAELESFKTPRHALRIRAQRPDPALENPNFFPSALYPNLKRKRESDGEDKAAKRSRDSGLVVNHCEFCPLGQLMPRATSCRLLRSLCSCMSVR